MEKTNKTNYLWETPNPIEAIQGILETMKTLEQNYFKAKKLEEEFNNKQSDLLHTLEIDLDDEEVDAVNKALRELRISRRDTKDLLINLAEAQSFIKENYKFMIECGEVVKKMQRTTQKVANRKYYLRDCEAMAKVIKMDNHLDTIHSYVPIESRKKTIFIKAEDKETMVDKFQKKWGLQS